MSHDVNSSLTLRNCSETLTQSIDMVMRGLSASSQQIYRQSYDKWLTYCQQNALHPLHDLTFKPWALSSMPIRALLAVAFYAGLYRSEYVY